ncbi:MAG: MarR family transcriptional regulator [Candidatus Devosia phytovorans]|uniref:MarR family transcriptional regulator n=1 Tax=Candidatus Devosia phytovorans TaxID=3121372 RepID=A0AAJ5VVM9_9HYPH|nr:MarR family transcriptional regulator [Devosia sp.]WEK04263.1 MAG: MarR family transcriptional regulator [Devosia sp.]
MTLHRETSIGYLTNWAARLLVRELDRQLAPLGLTPAHMPVLMALEAGDMTQKAIAQQAAVEQATMTATLNRMERDGLVIRRPNPQDGRSMLVSLTPLARGKLPQVAQAAQTINALAMETLTEAERLQYRALLGKVIATLEARDTGITG